MQTILIIGTIALLLFIWYRYSKTNYHFELNNITFFQGEIGSGKSAVITKQAIKTRWHRQNYNHIWRKILLLLIWLIPIFNIVRLIKKLTHKEYKVKLEPITEEIYSTFPICQKTIWDKEWYWSNVIDRKFFSWEYRIPVDKPIVVIDELEYLFPSETKKTDPIWRFGTAWIRHGISPTIFSSSQNLDGVNVEFRRRINNVYNLNGCKRCIFPFGFIFSKVQVQRAIVSENFTNVVIDNVESREENWYRFKFPSKNYCSRYGKNMYQLSDEEVHKLAVNYEALLKMMGLKNGDKWRKLEYTFD